MQTDVMVTWLVKGETYSKIGQHLFFILMFFKGLHWLVQNLKLALVKNEVIFKKT